MPRPAKTGYARIAQEEENRAIDDEDEEEEQLSRSAVFSNQISHYEPIRIPGSSMKYASNGGTGSVRGGRRRGQSTSSGVDIKAINSRLERWADEIASKFKRGKGQGKKLQCLEIQHSVFQPPPGTSPATGESLEDLDRERHQSTMPQAEFESYVERVEEAIDQGVQPKMISQGSSGSYFARDVDGKVVGVFKPKDEEPYAAGNPKWNKWIHRNLFPCFFGRSCLIPNLSYVSEAAAYVLDRQLRSNLVPYTDIVHLASISFHYDYWDRHSYYRRKKPLKPKVGSFQVFLKGFRDANIFLRENPWPDQYTTSAHRHRLRRRGVTGYMQACFTDGSLQQQEDDAADPPTGADVQRGRFFWSDDLKQSFREELEKLVILDYIMRNTDRGLDNWMIKVNWDEDSISPTKSNGANPSVLSQASSTTGSITMTSLDDPHNRSGTSTRPKEQTRAKAMPKPTISIGAIDNSLSWPWKHPDAWRSFPFGWLFLPVSLIGQPFSQRTRDHFLPLLTSTRWWSDTQIALRQVFSQDADFQEKMFAKQIAVMKGQAWNVVETLKMPDHGPLELTRRARVCVWDDQVEVPLAAPPAPMYTSNYPEDAEEEEEMDISAAAASAPLPHTDPLSSPLRHSMTGGGTPTRPTFARVPDEQQTPTISEIADAPMPPISPMSTRSEEGRMSAVPVHRRHNSELSRVGVVRNKSRTSLDGYGPSGSKSGRSQMGRRRGSSLSLGARGGHSFHQGDELEGDIGYAAATDMEKNLKLVIVERLEPVKTRNPVFTWC